MLCCVVLCGALFWWVQYAPLKCVLFSCTVVLFIVFMHWCVLFLGTVATHIRHDASRCPKPPPPPWTTMNALPAHAPLLQSCATLPCMPATMMRYMLQGCQHT